MKVLRGCRCLLMVSMLLLAPVLARGQTAGTETSPATEPAASANPFPPCADKPSESDVAAAQGAFQAGKVSFDEADYERAISYWEDAFRRDCTATALLLNLARAYELNEEPRNAVVALKTYLEREPETAERAPIEKRIEVLEQKEANQTQPSPAPTIGQRPVSRSTPKAAPPPAPAQPVQPAPPKKPAARRPITPLIVGGAGLAVFIGAGAIYLNAMNDVSTFEDVCNVGGERQCATAEQRDDANSARLKANISGPIALLGAATTASGVVWYFLTKPVPVQQKGRDTPAAKKSGSLRWTPQVSQGFAGLSVDGVF